MLEAKQETLRATETIAKEEEDRAHDNFMLETQRGEEIRVIQAAQTQAQAAIAETEERGRRATTDFKEALRAEEQRHSTQMVDLRSKLEYDASLVKDLRGQIAMQERAIADDMTMFHANADGLQAQVDQKEAMHVEALAQHKRDAQEQRDKMSMLKELPQDMKEIQILEALINESNLNVETLEQGQTAIQRNHYLGTAQHKEEIWYLTKELEQIKQYNARLANRMEWKLQNPYG